MTAPTDRQATARDPEQTRAAIFHAASLVASELDPRAIAVPRIGAAIGPAVSERPFIDDPEFADELMKAWPNVARAQVPRPETNSDAQGSDA